MKRIFIILTVILLMATACLAGCSNGLNALSESHTRDLSDNTVEANDESHTRDFSDNTVEANDKTVEIELVPYIFASFSEFESAVKNAEERTSDSSVADDINLGAISHYYTLEKAFEGFELTQIEVLPKRIIMYYVPNSSTSKAFDYNTGILVTYARREANASENPLAALADQVGMDLTNEGYLYDKKRNTITFAAGNSWMSIRVPDNMNEYKQLTPLCVATKNTIK
ncbi:MAG: hypothetical protein IKD31_03510 [Clostridia bacterium]|nr:hypothetical protein [Clostridia bacterium]